MRKQLFRSLPVLAALALVFVIVDSPDRQKEEVEQGVSLKPAPLSESVSNLLETTEKDGPAVEAQSRQLAAQGAARNPAPGLVVDRWSNSEILEERVLPLRESGVSQRLRLVRSESLKYPVLADERVDENGQLLGVASEVAADHVIVRFRDDALGPDLNDRLESVGLSLGERVSQSGDFLVMTSEVSTESAPAALTIANSAVMADLVEYSSYDYLRHPSLSPNDYHFGKQEQWGLHNPGGEERMEDADIDAPEGWELQKDAPNVIVAVVDTGVRYTHEDLAPNMWINADEIPGNGIDDDANGIVDDVYGFDAILNRGDPSDEDGHGTHVAGTIGASGNNEYGVTGVAWKVQLMAIKTLGSAGGFDSMSVAGIDYAVANGANVINASWGGGGYGVALLKSIERARDAGVIFVAAAGNDGTDNDYFQRYPTGFELDNIVSVANFDALDFLAESSNYGEESVDLAAPGTDILSTYYRDNADYEYLSGTSMAAPHVSGILALVKAKYPADNYAATIERLYQGAVATVDYEGFVRTGGRANLLGALTDRVLAPSRPADTRVAVVGGKVLLFWENYWTGELSGFRIERREDGADWVSLATLDNAARKFEDVPPDVTKGYVYRIIAYNASGDSLASKVIEMAGRLESSSGREAHSYYPIMMPLENSLNRFGSNVAATDEILAVSALADNAAGPNVGAIYLYDRFAQSGWGHRQIVSPSDGFFSDNYGYALALSGNTLAVGAYTHDGGAGLDAGAVYVYQRNEDGVWGGEQKVVASDAGRMKRFGFSVSLDGDTLAIGCRDDDAKGRWSGSVYVYTRGANGVWGSERKLVADDGETRAYFGWSVSVQGDSLAIGARGDKTKGLNAGAVYLYRRGGDSWTLEKKIFASDGAKYDYFGESLSLSGDRLIVGSPMEDTFGLNTGSVYFYSRSGGAWNAEQKRVAFNGRPNDNFGRSVSILGARCAVGSLNRENSYLFKQAASNWDEGRTLYFTEMGASLVDRPEFGASVCVTDTFVATGAPGLAYVQLDIKAP